MREILIGAVVGGLIAGLGVFWFMAKESEEVLSIFEAAEYARASTRAIQAYQHEEAATAIWELRHLADREREQLSRGGGAYGSNGMKAALILTRSRLAKLYHDQGRDAEAQTSASLAIQLLSELPGTNSTVTNLGALLERLRGTDVRASKQPTFE